MKDSFVETPLTLSTDKFFCDGTAKHFSQEISSLNLNGGEYFGKGINLKNPKTGGIEHFMYHKTGRDNEGDLTHWEFRSTKNFLILTIWYESTESSFRIVLGGESVPQREQC